MVEKEMHGEFRGDAKSVLKRTIVSFLLEAMEKWVSSYQTTILILESL